MLLFNFFRRSSARKATALASGSRAAPSPAGATVLYDDSQTQPPSVQEPTTTSPRPAPAKAQGKSPATATVLYDDASLQDLSSARGEEQRLMNDVGRHWWML